MTKNSNDQHQTIQSKMMDNFIIVSLNSNVDDFKKDKNDLVIQLQHIISRFETFIDMNECVDFLTDLTDEKVFMIIYDYSNQNFLPLIDEFVQRYSIYIFDKYEELIKECKSVKGVYTEIEHIYVAIKQDVRRLVINLTPISIISPNSSANLDELDQSFMYTQLLKEIIIDIEYDAKKAREEFTQFFHNCSAAKDFQSKAINQFERYYETHTAIWWYTKEEFVFSSLNKALRTQDIETIFKMGFFVQDLHQEIEKQYLETPHNSKIVVYRGQGLSNVVFEKLKKSEGGLLSFNCFLSTSIDRDISFQFADSNQQNPNATAVLYKMEIDPSISSMPFVLVENMSQFNSEAEILFTMHTVFRIGKMKQLDKRLWEVNLILTNDNDQQMKCLTDYVRDEIVAGNGWCRMAMLMMKMGKYDKAIEISNMVPEIIPQGDSEALEIIQTLMCNHIGTAQLSLGNYSAALLNYEKLLKMLQEYIPYNYTWVANLYNNIGLTYQSMGNFSSALINYEKALESQRQSLSPNSLVLGKVYSNIACVHQLMGLFPIALSYFEKALKINQTFLPSGHPHLSANYSNIGVVYKSLGNYSCALSYTERALETQQKYLPPDHPDLAMGHNNIGALHLTMGNYTIALAHHEKALEIQQQSLPSAHPDLVLSRNNIAIVYHSMGDFSNALSNLEEALYICQKSLSINHPNLALTYNNLSQVQQSMGDYSIALSLLEKALEIQQKSLSSDHPDLAKSYSNIGALHQLTGNYSIALSNYDRTLEIQQKCLPSDHSDLATTYNNIGEAHRSLGDYSTALSFYEKALEMWQRLLPSGHQNFAIVYNNIGAMHQSLGNYSTALSFYEKTLGIQQKSLSPDHPELVRTYNNIGTVSQLNQDFLPAISNMEKAFEIQQKQLPLNQPSIDTDCSNTSQPNAMMENYSALFSCLKRVSEIQQKLIPSDDSEFIITDENVDEVEELMGIYSTFMPNVEKALQLQKKSSSVNLPLTTNTEGNGNYDNQLLEHCLTAVSHLKNVFKTPSSDDQLANSRDDNNDEVPFPMDDFSAALIAYQKALEMQQNNSPPDDVSLSTNYNNIGQTYYSMGDYINALSLFEKALENLQKCRSTNHQLLAKTYNNIAMALESLGRYRAAIDYAKEAFDTTRSTLGPTHLETKAYQDRFDQLKRRL
jgi:tetratricopeptide (TPR) repeat protein